MVNIKDIEKLLEDYMLEPDIQFKELKAYLLSEFEWKADPNKSRFLLRGIPISDDKIIGDLLKSHMPNEVIVLKEMD